MLEWQKLFDQKILKKCLDIAAKTPDIKPEYSKILHCFDFFAPEDTRVVILGQDPYPGEGIADGLAFSSNDKIIPKSLMRIYKQLVEIKLIRKMPRHSKLDKWAYQGILLLNQVLTLGSDDQNYWKEFTEDILAKIIKLPQKIYFFLWGKKAQESFAAAQYIAYPTPTSTLQENGKFILEYKHPSPLSGGGWSFEGFKFIDIDWDVSKMRFYTDGGCLNNGKENAIAGWAVIPENHSVSAMYGLLEKTEFEYKDGKLLSVKNSHKPATNIRAEGYALIVAILKAKHWQVSAEIVIDCMHWVNVCTKWMQGWEKKGKIDEKENPDMIRILLQLTREVEVQFIYQRSHTGDKTRNALGNDKADNYATRGRNQNKFFIAERN